MVPSTMDYRSLSGINVIQNEVAQTQEKVLSRQLAGSYRELTRYKSLFGYSALADPAAIVAPGGDDSTGAPSESRDVAIAGDNRGAEVEPGRTGNVLGEVGSVAAEAERTETGDATTGGGKTEAAKEEAETVAKDEEDVGEEGSRGGRIFGPAGDQPLDMSGRRVLCGWILPQPYD